MANHRAVWIIAGDQDGVAERLAAELAAHHQTVVLTDRNVQPEEGPAWSGAGVFRASVEMERRNG